MKNSTIKSIIAGAQIVAVLVAILAVHGWMVERDIEHGTTASASWK